MGHGTDVGANVGYFFVRFGLEKLDGNGVMPKPPISPAPPARGTGEPVPAVPRKARVQGEDLPVFSSSLSAS